MSMNYGASPDDMKGKFKGVTKRINDGYFEKLGVTAIYLTPVSVC